MGAEVRARVEVKGEGEGEGEGGTLTSSRVGSRYGSRGVKGEG